MFEEVRGFFGLKQRAEPEGSSGVAPEDLRLAAAVLLVAAARVDDRMDPAESDFIMETIEQKFGLPRNKVEEFVGDAAAALDASAPSSFVSLINSHFSLEHREGILAVIWAVILADQRATAKESTFAANLRVTLGLSIEQALRARKTAEGVGIDGFKEILESNPDVQKATHDRAKAAN